MEAQSQGDEFAIGCIPSIKTTLCEEFQAQLISFDRPSNLLILHILAKIQYLRKSQEESKSGAGPKRNIRLLKANYIKEFAYIFLM
ncbi:hypothetical protein OROHE_000742 [Orobanche hederae]